MQLYRCVESIAVQLGPEDELILVIDHNEELLEILKSRLASVTAVIPNSYSRGLSGARNTGISMAHGALIAFVDDDAELGHGWIAQAKSRYCDAAVVAVGGYAQPIWPTHRPDWFPDEFDWVVGCSHRGLPTTMSAVRNVIGCNMTFRRVALQNIGGFSSRIGRVGAHPTGCEETEVCIRLHQRNSGSRVLFDPDLRVRHSVSEDRVSLQYFLRRCFSEGVSKALVSSMVGTADALSVERDYVRRVLPSGVARYLWNGLTGRDSLANFSRSAVVVLGLAVTALGYCTTTVRMASRGH